MIAPGLYVSNSSFTAWERVARTVSGGFNAWGGTLQKKETVVMVLSTSAKNVVELLIGDRRCFVDEESVIYRLTPLDAYVVACVAKCFEDDDDSGGSNEDS
jgi:hypothetical protein